MHPDQKRTNSPQIVALLPHSRAVIGSDEDRWTVQAAIEEAVPADVLSTALYARFRSRQEHNFGEKMLSPMRFGFGGHTEGNESIDPEPKSKELQRHSAAQKAVK